MLRFVLSTFMLLSVILPFRNAEAGLFDFLKSGINYEKLKPAVDQSLVNPEEFLRGYTDNGTVYFGSTIHNATMIPQKGLPMGSRPTYGPGLYTTDFRNAVALAHSHGHEQGMVVELKFVKASPRILRITETLIKDPQYTKLLKKSKN